MSVWIAIRTLRKISVEGSDDRITLLFFSTMSRPLSDTWTTSVGKYHTAHLIKSIQEAITSYRETHLLRTWGDGVLRFGNQFFVYRLLCQRGCTRDVFVGGVGARTDQAHIQLRWPAIFSYCCSKLRNRPSQIRREWTVDMRLKLGQVNLNHLIKIQCWLSIYLVVTGQVRSNSIGHFGDIRTTCTR